MNVNRNNLYRAQYEGTWGNLNLTPHVKETLSTNPLQQQTVNQKIMFTPTLSAASSRYVIRKNIN